jgi:Right handed beta helix region
MTRTTILAPALAAAVALALAPAAQAVDYPPAARPSGATGTPKGPFHTLQVGKTKRYKTIKAAVKAAKAGDTIKVASGTYREGVQVTGSAKRHLKIVGNLSSPAKVVLDGKGLTGAAAQNGIKVNGANEVSIRGITAQHYKANGVFLVNVTGYLVDHVRAMDTGAYGVYAFNSRGGTIQNSEAAWNNDSGFYIGQTPPQTKPIRSMVRGVKAYGNVLGFSGTNMRYVTITKSRWFNNGLGIVPNALDSEKFAPPEDNVITDNDVFWNNFDYFRGAPFPLRKSATGTVAYPVGTGILLFGSRRTKVTGNRVFGNYLLGIGGIQQLLLKQADAKDLIGNEISGNIMGAAGDFNGRDLFYDGDGSDNCFSGNTGVRVTVPADASTMAACPFSGANTFSSSAQSEAVDWTVGDPSHEANWIKAPHAPQAGIVPLEHYADYTGKKP